MKVNEQFSKKIAVLSFLAMISVVYIHHKAVGNAPHVAAWNAVAQRFCTRALTDWAVPFFFVVSGFWFARSAYVAAATPGGGYLDFVRKKARTLLVPYLLWAVIGAFLVMPVIVFNNHVNHHPLLDRTFLGAGDLWHCLDALVGVTRNGPIGDLALWYVRVLLLFFLSAPLWKALARCGKGVLLALGLALTLVAPEAWIPGLAIKYSSFGWLLLGMGAADWIADDRRLPRGAAILCGVAWVGLALAKAFGVSHGLERLVPFAGILFLWSIADWDRLWRDWMRPTFWVYCLHGALAGYTLAGPLFVFGKGDVATFLIMFVMPWANIAVCLLLARLVRLRAPRLYAALTGGRS